jgi:F-type H+-transporting ATPase subunit epsilon
MNEEILVRIITPSVTVLQCRAEIATIPGEYGEFGVLPKHSPIIANLHPGVMKVSLRNSNFDYFIYGGIAQVSGTAVNVVTEFAIELDKVKKSEILDQINLFKEKSSTETDPNKIFELHHAFEIYEALLSFLK